MEGATSRDNVGVCKLSLRVRFLITTAMLVLALSGTIIAARAAMGAIQQFQQQQTMTKKGDVRLIEGWMTIPYVAHIYHVPESYLYKALRIMKEDQTTKHSTLNEIAIHTKQPVETVIHKVQVAILDYRKQHPLPSPTPKPPGKPKPPAGKPEPTAKPDPQGRSVA
jgi:hypothetical protein